MAMDCGHHADLTTREARLMVGLCPPCGVPLKKHTQVLAHGNCSCCGECWVFKDDEIVTVVH